MGRTFKACVFDMDGVLIDTEPVWRQVEFDVFARVGVMLTDEQLRNTWGMRIEEVVDHWYQERPWNGIRPHAVQREIVREMVEYVRQQGVPMVGALEAIETARSIGLRIAIASSSSRELIDAVVDRLGIAALVDAICTADDEERGKPDPGVYLSAAQALDVIPSRCVAIEDSPVGVSAAVAAGMRCIGVRSHGDLSGDISHAHVVLDSLVEITPAMLLSADADPVGE
ncbi:MAG TPA: hexitol phosphatase HxpB [Candidatus Acidoferrales bacterium]|nr:hexitol phosphatase HxpB [Candidatus Acidoferrales bacterium]